jgi:flagellar biosynthesis protein FlhF
MNLKRFLAPTARDALTRIRQELGSDAVVVTSREVSGGIEIMAAPYLDLTEDGPIVAASQDWAAPTTAGFVAELKGVKQLIKDQLANLSWSVEKRRHPMRVELVRTLLNAGFSPPLARGLAARVSRKLDSHGINRWLRAVLIHNLSAWQKHDLMWVRGGAWALVGPTGAGKTTTLAKLAARAVDALGAHRVTLMTLDTYRIGAYEQIRTYADLLGVELLKAGAPEELASVLDTVRDGKLVLLDTPGLSPNDARIAGLQRQLAAANVQRVLVMTAAVQGPVVESTLAAYGTPSLAGCILSKLDEGGLIGPALDGLIRHRLPLAGLASGQRVPEDLYVAQPQVLIDRALRARQSKIFRMHEEDWPLIDGAEVRVDRHG